MKKKENLSFEESMENLENIVTELEKGDLSLEVSVEKFKEGMEISNYCTNLLNEAEESITILLKNQNGYTEEEFSAE